MPAILLILAPVILYLDIAPEPFNLAPTVFVGAGVFFCVMSYIPGATFTSAFLSEGMCCVTGLVFGWRTIPFRGWCEGRYAKNNRQATPVE